MTSLNYKLAALPSLPGAQTINGLRTTKLPPACRLPLVVETLTSCMDTHCATLPVCRADELIPDFERIRVLLSHDGMMHWEPGGIFRTTCDIDITYFPFDQQYCPLLIGE